jgi:calcineurin-like phosphoesterase family protein
MSESRVWVISDTHWNRNKIKTYCVRPPGYTERSIRLWNNTVKPEDMVIHLGDVAIGGYDQVKEILDSLPGTKVLVTGNHDESKSLTWWMRNGFVFACEGLAFRNIWLSHRPAYRLPPGCHLNVHGHLHIKREHWKVMKPFNKLFALEYTDYRPVVFDKFVQSPSIRDLKWEDHRPVEHDRFIEARVHPIPW